MALWKYRCYLDAGGEDVIRTWYESPVKDSKNARKIQTKFLSRLRALAGMPVQDWRLPLFRALHGECAGVGEIRFEVAGVQHRILGFQDNGIFHLLFPAKEKGNKFVPASACEIALARKQEVLTNPDRTHDLDWLAIE